MSVSPSAGSSMYNELIIDNNNFLIVVGTYVVVQCVCGAGGILCIYKCVEVCGGPCTNVYMCTKCGRRCLCWCV